VFFNGSRYQSVEDRWTETRDGRIIRHKAPRRVEPPAAPRSYVVRDPDRPDLAAWTAVGDPERFWELCDAAGEARPSDLTARPGRRIPLPGPEGIG
jgi:hypothetical protein